MTRETMKIIVPKGTEILSTHPTHSKVTSKAVQTVKNTYSKRDYLNWCNRIEWAGAGGYWRWAEINDEILEANPDLKEWIEEKKKNEKEENECPKK